MKCDTTFQYFWIFHTIIATGWRYGVTRSYNQACSKCGVYDVSLHQTATTTHVEKGDVILIFLRFSNNHADLRSDLFNLNMVHLVTYFAAVMLIQGTVSVCMCETSFSPISPVPVNLVTNFHQYRHEICLSFN